ncbi:MAG: hypothetical protein ACRYGK_15795 [Janthinobacterium lividum]
MQPPDQARPPVLYRFSERRWIERALAEGEFRLRPMIDERILSPRLQASGARLAPGSGYLTLALCRKFDPALFGHFDQADCCLQINDPELFGERLHRAVQRALPSWAGIDAAVTYGAASPLGKAFTKPREQAFEREWMFAWRPTQEALTLNAVVVKLGSLEKIAELREAPAP